MIPVREVMTRRVVMVRPGTTISDAAKIMSERRVGGVIVLEDKIPVGIVTERDILLHIVAPGKNPNKIRVKEIMSSPVITIDKEADINEAAKLMKKAEIRRLPVVERGKLVGIVTSADIMAVTPALNEILLEMIKTKADIEPKSEEIKGPGICENCGSYVESLDEVDGKWVCEDCREELVG